MATDSADVISNLPDEVLGAIVSRLPNKDGCLTQALSRRWRHIWRFAPLNLDDGLCFQMGFCPPPAFPKRIDDLSMKTVTSILSRHLGPPFRRISIGFSHLHYRCDRCKGHENVDDNIAGWIRSRVAYLEELALVHMYSPQCNTLPPSLFHRAPVLRVATFGRCRLPHDLAVDYPLLRQHTLYKVTLTEEALRPLLAGCPALEILLKEILGSSSLHDSSPTLRSIGFCASWESYSHIVNVKELVIEDTPCLERLLPLNPDHGPAAIRVIHAPKLEVLGFLSKGISHLHLGTTIVQELSAVNLTTTMHTVKVLALHNMEPCLDAVLNVLTCFPCLERLYIIFDKQGCPLKNIKNTRKHASPTVPIECLEQHLKKMSLKIYYGSGAQVDFVRFFVLNAKVLERMEFGLVEASIVGSHRDEWMANQNKQLQVEDRASRDARFIFKQFAWSSWKDNNHIHDLSMADPFDASFLDGYHAL